MPYFNGFRVVFYHVFPLLIIKTLHFAQFPLGFFFSQNSMPLWGNLSHFLFLSLLKPPWALEISLKMTTLAANHYHFCGM
jgi:hypothetical protein